MKTSPLDIAEQDRSSERVTAIAKHASLMLTDIMRGQDPSMALRVYLSGVEGGTNQQVSGIAGARHSLASSYIERVSQSRDSGGRDGFERFESALAGQLLQRLQERVDQAHQRTSAREQYLADQLAAAEDESERDQIRRTILGVHDSAEVAAEPVVFLTEYQGVQREADGEFRADNDLVYNAIVEAVTTESGPDAELARALNGLLPSKMRFEVGEKTELVIDGSEVTPEQ